MHNEELEEAEAREELLTKATKIYREAMINAKDTVQSSLDVMANVIGLAAAMTAHKGYLIMIKGLPEDFVNGLEQSGKAFAQQGNESARDKVLGTNMPKARA